MFQIEDFIKKQATDILYILHIFFTLYNNYNNLFSLIIERCN
jgi:hypothetical protein